MQGDLLRDCPVVRWSDDPESEQQQTQNLQQLLVGEAVDCIVMSQACDLEHGHVRNVILCPTYGLTEYKPLWQLAMEASKQNPTEKTWSRFLDDVSQGHKWNLSMISAHDPSDGQTLVAETSLIDFHEILSLPRVFLEIWTMRTAVPRLRLLPPYREHLSQAFARYFMRVCLPSNIKKAW
jgi:hypothetical protein